MGTAAWREGGYKHHVHRGGGVLHRCIQAGVGLCKRDRAKLTTDVARAQHGVRLPCCGGARQIAHPQRATGQRCRACHFQQV